MQFDSATHNVESISTAEDEPGESGEDDGVIGRASNQALKSSLLLQPEKSVQAISNARSQDVDPGTS